MLQKLRSVSEPVAEGGRRSDTWLEALMPTEAYNEVHYRIEQFQESEATRIYFVRDITDNQQFVVKVLRNYEDERYNLSTVWDRQQCQLEALRWNQKVTRGYIAASDLSYGAMNTRSALGMSAMILPKLKETLKSVEITL